MRKLIVVLALAFMGVGATACRGGCATCGR